MKYFRFKYLLMGFIFGWSVAAGYLFTSKAFADLDAELYQLVIWDASGQHIISWSPPIRGLDACIKAGIKLEETTYRGFIVTCELSEDVKRWTSG